MEIYLEVRAEEISNDQLHKEVVKMKMHETMRITQSGWFFLREETTRITRVLSGWIYETPGGRLFGGRNATFVPLP